MFDIGKLLSQLLGGSAKSTLALVAVVLAINLVFAYCGKGKLDGDALLGATVVSAVMVAAVAFVSARLRARRKRKQDDAK